MYIGKHTHGLYALPAIATIGSTLMLLNGPRLEDTVPIPFDKNEETTALLGINCFFDLIIFKMNIKLHLLKEIITVRMTYN